MKIGKKVSEMLDRRSKQVIYSGAINDMKLTGDVIKELGVTKVTLFGWIRNGHIKCEKGVAGSKFVYLFADEEIDRFKRFLPSKKKRKTHVLTPQILASIEADRK